MSAIITAILPALLQLLSETPSIVAEVESLWGFLTASSAPTADQIAQIEAALDQAHKDLQAS